MASQEFLASQAGLCGNMDVHPQLRQGLEALLTEMCQNPDIWQCKSVATTQRTHYIPSSVTQHNTCMNELTNWHLS